MAEIRPIRAWRYNEELGDKIDELTSPLFDVVSSRQREELYNNPFNSIHLSVPEGPNPAFKAQKLLQKWKDQGIIKQDPIPGIYIYYQYFTIPGSKKEYCRKGFMCNIRTYDWEENVILRHENTMPGSVNDRKEILEATELHVSATHGLYTDETFTLEPYMDESMNNIIHESEDYQGVRDVLSVIHDAEVIKKFINLINEKQIILADGHHRYAGSLEYRKEQMAKNPAHTGKEGYNYHFMYLTNTEAHDLRILPTHRLVSGLDNFHKEKLMKDLEKDFIIKHIPEPFDINEIILGKKWAFGILFKDDTFKVRLKPEAIDKFGWDYPEKIKRFDIAVLHYFIIEKALGIKREDQTTSKNITFDRNFTDCLTKVIKGDAQMAIITQEVSIEDVKDVCYSGYTMPQKSTYFYPKVICGFLFSSIKEDEFELYAYSGV